MPHYQVTLNQGRTDTVTAEFDSLVDCKTFWESVSTANITIIKKIVYSKQLEIGTALTTYTPNNQDRFLNILVRNSKGQTGTLNIQYPIKNLTKDTIIDNVKKYLLLNGESITEVLNILRKDME